jgi:hypothetical protein
MGQVADMYKSPVGYRKLTGARDVNNNDDNLALRYERSFLGSDDAKTGDKDTVGGLAYRRSRGYTASPLSSSGHRPIKPDTNRRINTDGYGDSPRRVSPAPRAAAPALGTNWQPPPPPPLALRTASSQRRDATSQMRELPSHSNFPFARSRPDPPSDRENGGEFRDTEISLTRDRARTAVARGRRGTEGDGMRCVARVGRQPCARGCGGGAKAGASEIK